MKLAQSSTERAMGPMVAGTTAEEPNLSFFLGLMESLKVSRLGDGLNPTTPQHEAGIRIDPAPSAETESGAHPMLTKVASPPDDPPGERLKSHGLRLSGKIG